MNDLLKIIVEAIDEKQGLDLCVLDFRNISPLTDYFVITHVNNHRLMNAILDNVVAKVEQTGHSIKSIEGNQESGWLLIDAYDVIIHIFMNEQREYYALEKLWSDIPQVNLNEIL